MSDSVFTKIIRGEIPCHKIYEDEKTFAFMDMHPIQSGMALVVTKNPAEVIWDLPQEDYRALWATVNNIGRRMREVFPQKKRIGVQVEGLEVPHVHVKIFPIDDGDEFRAPPKTDPESPEKLAEIAKKLRF